MIDDKVHENRVRRWAVRLGYRVEKSRARLLHLNNRGLYQLLTADQSKHNGFNNVVLGRSYDANLEAIEAYLANAEEQIKQTGWVID